jgi:hypothetical protein
MVSMETTPRHSKLTYTNNRSIYFDVLHAIAQFLIRLASEPTSTKLKNVLVLVIVPTFKTGERISSVFRDLYHQDDALKKITRHLCPKRIHLNHVQAHILTLGDLTHPSWLENDLYPVKKHFIIHLDLDADAKQHSQFHLDSVANTHWIGIQQGCYHQKPSLIIQKETKTKT